MGVLGILVSRMTCVLVSLSVCACVLKSLAYFPARLPSRSAGTTADLSSFLPVPTHSLGKESQRLGETEKVLQAC